jgi:C1A family cysteine protease
LSRGGDDNGTMGAAHDIRGGAGTGRGWAPALWLILALSVLLCATLPGAFPARAGEGPSAAGAQTPWALAGSFPRTYDLRRLGRVTPVRQQSHYSTCWNMAAMASLESCLLPRRRLDLSENNLADHNGSRLVFSTSAEGYANSRLSTAYFARWDGPVLDRQDPYPRPGHSREGLRPAVHVQDVLYLPGRSGPADNRPIKWALVKHGAVDTAMAFVGADYLRVGTHSYYCPQPGRFLNHHVTCVGWDDRYPASRFKRRPPGDGAFLVKNSWGTDWGAAGYFWVSYYDADFGREMAVFDGVESASNYDAIYQYDALGWTKSLGFGGDTAWFANRFRCAGSGTLSAVSFYTPAPGASYAVRVAGAVGSIGTAPVVASGTLAVGGYHTVQLSAPPEVAFGRDFVVAVELTTPGSTRPIPLEAPTALVTPRAAHDQSYVSADGAAWTDLTRRPGYGSSNVCLKAFVNAPSGWDSRAPKATVHGATARPLGTVKVSWALSDPPFSCASAVIVLQLHDRSGLVIASQRIPAVAVGETGVWRFRCYVPAGVYRLSARACDVAGNAQLHASEALLRVTGAGAPAGAAKHS